MSLNLKQLLNKPIMFYVSLFLLLSIIFYRPQNNNYQRKKESFLSPGEYPKEVTYPLLYGDYELKKKHYNLVSKNNYSDNYEYYPIFSSDSLNINNIRYWKNPDNGTFSTADFCDVLYNETPDKKHYVYGNNGLPEIKTYPPQPEWGASRVNYYESTVHNT